MFLVELAHLEPFDSMKPQFATFSAHDQQVVCRLDANAADLLAIFVLIDSLRGSQVADILGDQSAVVQPEV